MTKYFILRCFDLLTTSFNNYSKRIDGWSKTNLSGLFVFNIVMIVLVLLHSAGYFHPFFPLTINIIIMAGLILSSILLKIKPTVIFLTSLFFLMFAILMSIGNVDIWSERTMIYMFESFVLGIILVVVKR